MKNILIAGLGNPGKKYEKTRHNAGFMFVDYFLEKFREEFGFLDWEFKKNLNAEISVGKFNDKKIIMIKPQTFMNLSGEAIKKTMKYHKARLEDLIVVHDDVDLALGKHKISIDSRAAGHNGVQNIIDILGTKNFTRIRIGIENREDRTKPPTEKYVLGKFTVAEMKVISKILLEILKMIIKKL
jgi:peptidyl-tRNA hydrolase, PTH1 family